MIIDAAFSTFLNATSASIPIRSQCRITLVATATSETPLPEDLALPSILKMPTQGVTAQRAVRGELDAIANHLSAAGILPLSEDAQVTVDQILAKNRQATGKKRVLLPRQK